MFNRRDFLKSAVTLPMVAAGAGVSGARNCIFLMLVGGPSQLDTWDPKPDAPSYIRGPYRPIKTNVAGIEISEIFPRMARHADKYALLRGCYHNGEPVHDVGHQLVQTGYAFEEGGVEHPHIGCVASLDDRPGSFGRHFLLPGPIGKTGGNLPHGQSAGYLGTTEDPRLMAPAELIDRRYGRNRFGQSVAQARQLVESGNARFVTVNMFETVFDQITWDIHGSAPFSPMNCYADHVGPMFDQAYSALLEDLHHSGHLENTLVVATGEFGRTPRINPAGGRDHWTECWTMLMAGGGVQGGQVIGASDGHGAEPRDRPVHAAEIAATVYHAMGIDSNWLPKSRPVMELFG